MRKRDKRLIFIVVGLIILGAATILAMFALKSKVSFFYAPADVMAAPPAAGTSARLGGLVANGSVAHENGGVTKFDVTDGKSSVAVVYKGVLPDLFREGQGVVAEGQFDGQGHFNASMILAKHDETYMPKEVVDGLKRSGQWKGAPMTQAPKTGTNP